MIDPNYLYIGFLFILLSSTIAVKFFKHGWVLPLVYSVAISLHQFLAWGEPFEFTDVYDHETFVVALVFFSLGATVRWFSDLA